MGKIIVIEGLDASGKDTQSRLLQEKLQSEGFETYKLDLPYKNVSWWRIRGQAF